jgi:hypothetical protein
MTDTGRVALRAGETLADYAFRVTAERDQARAMLREVRDWAVRQRKWLVMGGTIVGERRDVGDFDDAIARFEAVLGGPDA